MSLQLLPPFQFYKNITLKNNVDYKFITKECEYIYKKNKIIITKKNLYSEPFSWMGTNIEPGNYNINFHVTLSNKINNNSVGIKHHYPECTYPVFNEIEPNTKTYININIIIHKMDHIVFIFDEIDYKLNVIIEDLVIKKI